jgi:hypothetical protein
MRERTVDLDPASPKCDAGYGSGEGTMTVNDMQIIHSPSGDELVVIPRAEYDALLAAANAYAADQSDIGLQDPRTAEERHRMTLEALADVDAGRSVAHAAVQEWAQSLDTDKPLPLPG